MRLLAAATTAAILAAGVPTGMANAAPDLPTPDEMTDILSGLADPGAMAYQKNGLVAGGIESVEGEALDALVRRATRHQGLPLSFTETNVVPVGATGARADVTITGRNLPQPVTKPVMFVNVGGSWKLAHDTAVPVLKDVMP